MNFKQLQKTSLIFVTLIGIRLKFTYGYEYWKWCVEKQGLCVTGNSLSTMDNYRYQQFTFDQELHNFQKDKIRVGLVEDKNIFEFKENDTRVTGLYGDTWNLLSIMRNFTLIPVNVQCEKYKDSSVLELVRTNEIDIHARMPMWNEFSKHIKFIMPMSKSDYRFLVKHNVGFNEQWVFKIYSIWVPLVFIGTIFLVILFDYFRQQLLPGFERSQEYLIYISSLIANQATDCKNSKVIFILVTVMSFFMLTVFSSKAYIFMTGREIIFPFIDLKSFMVDTNYKLVGMKRSPFPHYLEDMSEKLFSYSNESKRFEYVETYSDMYSLVCSSNEQLAAFDSVEHFEAYSASLCPLMKIPESYFLSYWAAGIAPNFKYKRSLDISMIKLYEVGVLKRLRSKWKTIPATGKSFRTSPIVMDQLHSIFVYLILSYSLSLFLLALEYFYHRMCCQRFR